MYRNIIFVIALGILAYQLFAIASPLIDPIGEITDGSYRGIKIGDSKADVVGKLYQSRLRTH